MKKNSLPFLVFFLVALNLFILFENNPLNISNNIGTSVYSDENIDEWTTK